MRQTPAPGSELVFHKGDIIEFTLRLSDGESGSGRAWLRATIGNARIRRHEIIDNAERGRPVLDRDWHDIPRGRRIEIGKQIMLTETGRTSRGNPAPRILIVTPEITYLPSGMGNMANCLSAKAGGLAEIYTRRDRGERH